MTIILDGGDIVGLFVVALTTCLVAIILKRGE